MKKQILLLLLGLPGMAYPMMGNARRLVTPAYTGVRSYVQPAGYRLMSNVPKNTMPLSLQAAALRSPAMPAISTMQTPQRQFGAEVWGPALMGAGAGWFGRSLYSRFNQYWNKPVTLSATQPISRMASVFPSEQTEITCPIKTINELFDPQKAINIAQMQGAPSFIGLIKRTVRNVNEAVPSDKVIIPERVVEALDLLSVYPDLKANSNQDLARSIRLHEELLEEAMMNEIDPKSRAFSQKHYTQEIEQLKAIQQALNR